MDAQPLTAQATSTMPDNTQQDAGGEGAAGANSADQTVCPAAAPVVERMDRLIGCTPLLHLPRISGDGPPVYVKLEHLNPSGSIRDRYLAEILLRARDAGQLMAGDTVSVAGIDDCSVAAAFLAPRLDLNLRVFAAESASRRLLPLIERYGPDIVWLDGDLDWRDAVDEAVEWARKSHERMFVNGYRREAVRDSYSVVADEILTGLEDQPLGAFVTSVTTGGAYRQVTGELRETHPEMLVGGAVLTEKKFPTLDDEDPRNVLVEVDIEEAWEMRDRLARTEGLLLGPKGAASVALAVQMQDRVDPDSALVALNPDAGQRYLGWEDESLYELERGP